MKVQNLIKVLEKIEGNFMFPKLYLRVQKLELINYDLWYLLNADDIVWWRNGLLKRYPDRNLIPFAKRNDNDDTACFEEGYGEKIFIVHDFASPGWERRQEYENFETWFMEVIKEMIEYEDFEEQPMI